jgi:hypothetical protein
MHDIISDILDWDEARKAYLAGEGETGERYDQRLEASDLMAEIESRWQHLPGGFHAERKRIKIHVQAVADAAPSMSSEDLCWLAIAAASAWIPNPTTARGKPSGSAVAQVMSFAAILGALALGPSPLQAAVAKSSSSHASSTCRMNPASTIARYSSRSASAMARIRSSWLP